MLKLKKRLSHGGTCPEEMKSRFGLLNVKQFMYDQIVYFGTIYFTADNRNRMYIDEEFEVEIGLPTSNSSVLPWAKETGGRIQNFHQNTDSLCLEAPYIVRERYHKNPTLDGFIEFLLIPFFWSFCYYTKNGIMADGERSHGRKGIIESYQEIFNTNSTSVINKFLELIAEKNYDRHMICPCGSKKKIMNCHGQIILQMKNLQSQHYYLSDIHDIQTELERSRIKYL
jgi:hypothetical protein